MFYFVASWSNIYCFLIYYVLFLVVVSPPPLLIYWLMYLYIFVLVQMLWTNVSWAKPFIIIWFYKLNLLYNLPHVFLPYPQTSHFIPVGQLFILYTVLPYLNEFLHALHTKHIENKTLLLGEGSYMDEDLELLKVAAGLETVQLGSIGVYHYRLSDSARNVSTCSIISKPGPRVRYHKVICRWKSDAYSITMFNVDQV